LQLNIKTSAGPPLPALLPTHRFAPAKITPPAQMQAARHHRTRRITWDSPSTARAPTRAPIVARGEETVIGGRGSS